VAPVPSYPASPQRTGARAATVVSPMRTFYTLHVHRKDGSWHCHLMRGELPKVGDTIPVLLPGENIMAKVGAVAEECGEPTIKVMADKSDRRSPREAEKVGTLTKFISWPTRDLVSPPSRASGPGSSSRPAQGRGHTRDKARQIAANNTANNQGTAATDRCLSPG
jgi:hypothetical protein